MELKWVNIARKLFKTNFFRCKYLLQCDALIELKELSFQEFEKAFNILKQNKAIDCNDFNGNIILDVYDSVKLILFRYLLKKHSFLKHLKLQKVMQACQKCNKENVENCWPISSLSVFSKVLKRILFV